MLVAADARLAITLAGGGISSPRSVLRFDHTAFFAAGRENVPTPVVFDPFLLDTAWPVVRYRISAIALARAADGSVRVDAVPLPDLGRRNAARNAIPGWRGGFRSLIRRRRAAS
ncbi:hypothetical protein V1227_08390 [Lentzea sp. DG1S-22]|uniref:hypothetical protein n=1 Tax=Lentzea sp. DG1S-22 TaxID=3108822 RepID=UPI002E77781D|nr:hypothetical protein [Lentzea sp. DG1S-22]WVH82758.1 hypothetical protein V1227_08390 [Lentzea sp. DG1S-22]